LRSRTPASSHPACRRARGETMRAQSNGSTGVRHMQAIDAREPTAPISSSHIESRKNPAGATESNAGQVDSGGKTATSKLWNVSLRWTAPWPRVFGFLCELRSCFGRMAVARQRGWYISGRTLAADAEFDLKSYSNPDSRLRVRSADMQRLDQTYEWVSISDSWLFDLGWDRGAKWKDSHSNNEL